VGVSLEDVESTDSHSKSYRFVVYRRPSECTKYAYRLARTPATIVISPTQGVVKTWYGAYLGKTRREIESYFELRLPASEE
jgi:hypothetical protein